jgi:TPR repeat protein
MYDEGQGVSQDYKEAIKWYRLAAEQRDEKAQINLALMHDGSLDCLNSPN